MHSLPCLDYTKLDTLYTLSKYIFKIYLYIFYRSVIIFTFVRKMLIFGK